MTLSPYTVKIDSATNLELEMLCSPMDYLVVHAQLMGQLPALHQSRPPCRSDAACLPLYRACMDWNAVTLLYTELEGVLHVLAVKPLRWSDQPDQVDLLLPYDAAYDPMPDAR